MNDRDLDMYSRLLDLKAQELREKMYDETDRIDHVSFETIEDNDGYLAAVDVIFTVNKGDVGSGALQERYRLHDFD